MFIAGSFLTFFNFFSTIFNVKFAVTDSDYATDSDFMILK